MNPITRMQMSWALSQVRLRPTASLAVKLEKMANVIFQPRAVPAHVPQASGYVHPALQRAAAESPWEVEGPLSDHLDIVKNRQLGSSGGTVAETPVSSKVQQGTGQPHWRPRAETMLSPASKVSLWDRLRAVWRRGKTASLPRLVKRAINAMNPLHTGYAGGVSDMAANDATEPLDDSGTESAGRPSQMGWKAQGGSYAQQTYAVGAQGRSTRPSTTQAQGSAPATQAMAAPTVAAAPPVKLASWFRHRVK